RIGGMDELYSKMHRTIKQVTEDIEVLHYNTALSAIMELINNIFEVKNLLKHPTRSADYKALQGVLRKAVDITVLLLSPFAPHLCEELWSRLGGNKKKSILLEKWLSHNPSALKLKQVELAIQINGKVRSRITLPTETPEDEIKQLVLKDDKVKVLLQGKTPKKIIVIPTRLVNIVV
ncbi:MAG: class I tRNA ligase family protein, partial [Planctomycetota bacterium]|nr:class I tRNA ligase family protein [Planctomycetota bacterium]